MKKLLIIPLILIVLTGCSERTNEYEETMLDSYYIYVDKDTCVEYFVSNSMYNSGNFTPRYNADLTLKVNKKCIISKEISNE